jgi:hypothetical protein
MASRFDWPGTIFNKQRFSFAKILEVILLDGAWALLYGKSLGK